MVPTSRAKQNARAIAQVLATMSKRKHHLVNKTLKIPKSDFPSLGKSASTSSPPPPLLLVQLPTNLTTKDLIRSHFILQHDSDKCRLVSQEKGLTFDLVKVETSNSYVLIKDDGDTNDASSSSSSENVPSDTKQEDKEARLVREKNTFFLECIQIKAGLQSKIEMILKTKSYVYPTKGISVDGICQQVMHSKKEVQAALNDMKAFNIFSSTDPSGAMYGTLSEEMEREVWYVIRRVLSEWDGGNDYAGKGVLKEDMITQIMDRNDGCEDDINEGVLRHCLEKCTLEVAGEYTKLNVDHVSNTQCLLYCCVCGVIKIIAKQSFFHLLYLACTTL